MSLEHTEKRIKEFHKTNFYKLNHENQMPETTKNQIVTTAHDIEIVKLSQYYSSAPQAKMFGYPQPNKLIFN